MAALTTSVTTAAGLVTIQVDCDSAAGYTPPYVVMSEPGFRNPLATTPDALFLGSPVSASEQKLVKTGAPYVDFVRLRVYAAAGTIAANVPQLRMNLGYTDYLVQLNGTLPNDASNMGVFCQLDAAGTAALQPALRNTMLGLSSFFKVRVACPSTPGMGAGTTRAQTYHRPRTLAPARGPLSAPVISKSFLSGRVSYWDAGTMWVGPDLISAPTYSVAAGMPNNALWYVSRCAVTTGAAVPTLTVAMDWLDSNGSTISTSALGTFSLTLVTSSGGNDYYGGAGDLDLTVPSMPSTARYYRLTKTPSVAIPNTIAPSLVDIDNLVVGLRSDSTVTLSPADPTTSGGLANDLVPDPAYSFDGSMYRPGVLFAP